jgi:hypothetical protein
MRHQLLLAPLAFSVFVSVPLAPAVVFAPADGTTLTKRFVTNIDFELAELTGSVNGDEEGLGMFGDPTEAMESAFEETVVVSDEYIKVADGRPLELVRHFVEWDEETTDEQPEGEDGDVFGRVLGTRVKFLWNEDDEEYEASFVGDEEGDEDDLAKLEEDMDLRMFLPDDDVDEGDSWSVPLEALLRALNPGRSIALENEDLPEEIMAMFTDALEDAEIECTFTETRADGEIELAVIELTANVSASLDLSDMIPDLMADGAPEGFEIDCETFSVDISIPLVGELLWNSASGHVHALELSADATAEIELAGTMGPPGMGFEIEAAASLALSAKHTLTLE